MTDQCILDRLKKVLGSLYDPDKEDMYVRVVRQVLKSSPLNRPSKPIFNSLSQRNFGSYQSSILHPWRRYSLLA